MQQTLSKINTKKNTFCNTEKTKDAIVSIAYEPSDNYFGSLGQFSWEKKWNLA